MVNSTSKLSLLLATSVSPETGSTSAVSDMPTERFERLHLQAQLQVLARTEPADKPRDAVSGDFLKQMAYRSRLHRMVSRAWKASANRRPASWCWILSFLTCRARNFAACSKPSYLPCRSWF